MARGNDGPNVSVAHGRWGEDVAVEELRLEGLTIVERNARPCRDDRRIEIDIVAYDRRNDVLVFVEVKQHRRRSPWQRRMRSVGRHKLELLRRGCRTWIRRNRWSGGFRFDVIEIYGTPERRERVEVDHIRHVRLFKGESLFVNWEE